MAATRAIHLRTEIPGPRSSEIVARKERVVADALALFLPIVAAEGRGALLTDVDGNTFVDFTGGVGCLAVGHAHPHVVAAVQEQAARFLHTDFTIVPYDVYVTYAERLLALAPFAGPAKAAFFNAGTEAVENAVKFARAYTKRPAVIAFEGAFHGRTLMSLTLTSKAHPYKAGLGPFAPEVYRVPFPNEYRGISATDALIALEAALLMRATRPRWRSSTSSRPRGFSSAPCTSARPSAPAWPTGRRDTPGSATSAGPARCSRSSSLRIRRAASPLPSSRPPSSRPPRSGDF